ncbi:MAG: hypothetical protein GX367_03250 [Bacteroidales bacterium]|jgi:hypothetical protein|nr:hypothetical protein [Bacteroidales bacterium]
MYDVRKKRRYRFKSLFSLFLVSMLMLVSYIPAFAQETSVDPVITEEFRIDDIFSSVTIGSFSVVYNITDSTKYVPNGVKYGELKFEDSEERYIKTLYAYSTNTIKIGDGSALTERTFKEAFDEGLIKIRRSDGTYVTQVSDFSIEINSDIFYVELYGPVKRSNNQLSAGFPFGKIAVVSTPLFVINNTTLSTVKDTDLVIGGTITSGFENADIEYRINDGSWSTTGVDHNGVGVFTITNSNSSFPFKTNTVDVRVRDQYGIYSKIIQVSVTNNFVDTENPNPNPGDCNNNNNPPPSGGGSGSLKINFNVGDMFTHSNSVLSGFMILLTVIVGISVGFRVVRFVKDLF